MIFPGSLKPKERTKSRTGISLGEEKENLEKRSAAADTQKHYNTEKKSSKAREEIPAPGDNFSKMNVLVGMGDPENWES